MTDPDVPGGPTVAVVLVEFRSAGLVAERATWARDQDYFVAVADNSATYDGPGLVVDTGGNVGFGAACNRAVEQLPPWVEIVVFMNPDAEITSADLAELIRQVRGGAWQLLAPATKSPSGATVGFRLPDPHRELAVTLREARRLRKERATPTPAAIAPGSRSERPRTAAGRFGSGALVVIDRAAFESVGGYDDRYFLYVEDADLWDRVERSGARVGFHPGALLVHRSGSGSPASRASRAVLRRLGVELYLEDRGRPIRLVRRAHRLLFPAIRGGDELAGVVDEGYRSGTSAAEISLAVRDAALAAR